MKNQLYPVTPDVRTFLSDLHKSPHKGITGENWSQLCCTVANEQLLAVLVGAAYGFQIAIIDPADSASRTHPACYLENDDCTRAFRVLVWIQHAQLSDWDGFDGQEAQLERVGRELTHTKRNWRLARGCGFDMKPAGEYAY